MITYESIEAVRSCLERLCIDNEACRATIKNLVAASVTWEKSTRSDPSPGDAKDENIKNGRYGLQLYLGETFLIEKAIRDCEHEIKTLLTCLGDSNLPMEPPQKCAASNYRSALRSIVRLSVADRNGQLCLAHGDDRWMKFGNHWVNLHDFVNELWEMCELDRIFDSSTFIETSDT